jgi:hypothetical protein
VIASVFTTDVAPELELELELELESELEPPAAAARAERADSRGQQCDRYDTYGHSDSSPR